MKNFKVTHFEIICGLFFSLFLYLFLGCAESSSPKQEEFQAMNEDPLGDVENSMAEETMEGIFDQQGGGTTLTMTPANSDQMDLVGGVPSPADEAGLEGGSVSTCIPMSTLRCVGNEIYWVDSCGVQGELVQSCAENQRCEVVNDMLGCVSSKPEELRPAPCQE